MTDRCPSCGGELAPERIGRHRGHPGRVVGYCAPCQLVVPDDPCQRQTAPPAPERADLR